MRGRGVEGLERIIGFCFGAVDYLGLRLSTATERLEAAALPAGQVFSGGGLPIEQGRAVAGCPADGFHVVEKAGGAGGQVIAFEAANGLRGHEATNLVGRLREGLP